MISFRKFFHNRFEKIKQKSGMPLWSEMAVHVNDYDLQIPIPKMVGVILNHVPNEHQATVLKWIFSEGLRQASIGRRAICEYASEILGRPVAQEEVFSKVAHERDPDGLGKLYDEKLKELWMKNYEPKTFPVYEKGTKKIIHIKFADLNGMKQIWMGDDFTFGLTGGLMEWIEEGKGWASHKGEHATHHKHGPDLALSTNKENGKFTSNGLFQHSLEKPWQKAVVLGREGLKTPFKPAEKMESYKDAIEQLKIHTLKKFKELIDHYESGKEFDNEDDSKLAVSLSKLKKDGKIITRKILPISLSYDHRFIDGAEGARFCVHLSQSLGKDFAFKLAV